MDSFEINKIAGALFGTLLAMVALNIAAEAVFEPAEPAKPGYEIEVKQAAPAASEKPAPEVPIEQALASASAERGQATAKQCATCHTFDKGGPNKTGPNLWDVVGRARATQPGFAYSTALKAKGGTWTIDELNQFLTNPRGYIPGVNMSFAGIAKENQRADVIAYLNTLADTPKPLPVAKK